MDFPQVFIFDMAAGHIARMQAYEPHGPHGIDEPEKNWRFSLADIKERGYWKRYKKAYECLGATSTIHSNLGHLARPPVLTRSREEISCFVPRILSSSGSPFGAASRRVGSTACPASVRCLSPAPA